MMGCLEHRWQGQSRWYIHGESDVKLTLNLVHRYLVSSVFIVSDDKVRSITGMEFHKRIILLKKVLW